MDAAHIRNFSIIAHIDHGKTTLSDRLLHRTGTISDRQMENQLLDSMDLEKERGITIKAHPVTMLYKARDGETYELNLIDTPGHVDFSYEVSRSLSACEGALLIVDAAQGVEAQTVANVHLAMKQNLEIIPVINKIDLPHANVAQTRQQLEEILAIPGETAIPASAKEGIGIEEILEAIVARIPPPKPTGGGDASSPKAVATAASREAAEASPLPFVGFDPKAPVGFLRGDNLPHWRQNGATYFVTWRTMDSLPRERVDAWFAEREDWLKKHPEPWDAKTEEAYYRLFPDRWEKWLDESHGECLLAKPELRKIVQDILLYNNARERGASDGAAGSEMRASHPPKYQLKDFIIMPNHVHVLATPLLENTLSDAVQEWKSVSAHRINKALGRQGELWQKEYFDHIVRSAEQLEKFRNYIQRNPLSLPDRLRGAVAFSCQGSEALPSPSATGASRLRHSLQALAFDSYFDTFKGVVTHVRVFNGEVRAGMQVKLLYSGKSHEVKEVGSFNPKPYVREKLEMGETGYITANIKTPQEVKMGDTITDARNPAPALPGFKEIHPMVFSGIYPINTADYEHLKVAMAKLKLNDSAFAYQPETSVALGFGFRCGFLGLLHMEIVQERLRREYNMDIIATYPSVVYHVTLTNGAFKEVDNPAFLPEVTLIEKIEEPVVKTFIICPNENIGDMMALISEKRGSLDHTETLDTKRVMLTAVLPLNEILIDFHDRIKSMTRGYGSMDYEQAGYQESDMVRLDMLVNGEPMDAFSCIVHRSKAEGRGRALATKLKQVVPRQQFQVKIQAAIGGKIIASEHVSAFRKDVTAKCYGGDITRKRKLLEKQKEGKKRMKSIGNVNIPQEAFIEVLKA